MYFVYIIRSRKDHNIYAGYTNNVDERLKMHNSGKVVATRHRRPFTLIYYESYCNQQDATAREKYYKTGWGRTHLKKVLKNYYRSEEGMKLV